MTIRIVPFSPGVNARLRGLHARPPRDFWGNDGATILVPIVITDENGVVFTDTAGVVLTYGTRRVRPIEAEA